MPKAQSAMGSAQIKFNSLRSAIPAAWNKMIKDTSNKPNICTTRLNNELFIK